MKKIDNRKIDFYFINYFYKYFFFVFTGGCNLTPYKKMEQEVANQPYTAWQEKKLQIEVVQN